MSVCFSYEVSIYGSDRRAQIMENRIIIHMVGHP